MLERMRGPAFHEARTPSGFAMATVDAESGTAAWAGGADLAPDTLYERLRTGAWPDRHLAACAGHGAVAQRARPVGLKC